MERKMDFWTIEIKTKFKEKAIVDKLQKDLIDKFNYECSKNKDYMAQVIIGVSNINPRYVIGIYNEKTGKCGRPKKKKDLIKENDLTKIVYGNLYTEWHIHILALTSPGETFARIIKEYIDKKFNVYVSYKKFEDDDKNDIDIGMLLYIARQCESDSILFVGSNDKRFNYTFKQMYEESVKKYSNLKFNKRYLKDEEYRNKLDKKYNDMLDYFNLFYSEEKKTKKEKEYKEKARIRKIAERYDEINNKVRKKSSSKNNKYINVIKV